MCSLTITDAAYSRIQRELADSPIECPIVSLVQSAGAKLPPYAMLRAIDPDASDSNLHDLALERDGPDSPSLPWKLIPGVYSREDVPIESRVEIRGIWFSFSPQWQQRMKGWELDAVGDTLVLKDATGKVILPSNPDAADGVGVPRIPARASEKQEPTMSHVQVAKDIYLAFGRGDIPAVLAAFHPEIQWRQAEGHPYQADSAPWVGPQAVLDKLFMRLGGEWEGFTVSVRELHDAGEVVVMEGRYTGTYKPSGRSLDAQVCHVLRFRDGKLFGFQQYMDTGQLQTVMAPR